MKLYTPKFKEEIKKNEKGEEVKTLVPATTLSLYEMIEGKQYFYGQAIPESCEEVVDFEGKEEEFVAVFKDRAMFEKSKEFRLSIERFLDSYIPQEELLSWDMQYQEALSYKQNPNSEVPLITAICKARYGTLDNLEVLVEKILEKSMQYKLLSGNLIGQKQAIIDKIENAKSMAELLNFLELSIVLPSKDKQ